MLYNHVLRLPHPHPHSYPSNALRAKEARQAAAAAEAARLASLKGSTASRLASDLPDLPEAAASLGTAGPEMLVVRQPTSGMGVTGWVAKVRALRLVEPSLQQTPLLPPPP